MKVSSLFHAGRFEPTAQNPKRERERDRARECGALVLGVGLWTRVEGVWVSLFGLRLAFWFASSGHQDLAVRTLLLQAQKIEPSTLRNRVTKQIQ